MPNQIALEELRRMLAGFAAIIRNQHGVLTDLDSAVGDGDHGITMLRGAEHIEELLLKPVPYDLASLLHAVGWEFVSLDGGAAGPLIGTIFLGMAAACQDRTCLDVEAFASMFESGLVSLQSKTQAKLGDKTLLDALVPAVEAILASASQNDDIGVALRHGAKAALAGARATTNLVARFGRAKNLGDRTKGYQDPGATTLALLFTAFSETISEQ